MILSTIWLSALTFLPNCAQAEVEAEVILRSSGGFEFSGNELIIDDLQPGQRFSVDLLVRTLPGTLEFSNLAYMQLDLRASYGATWDPVANCGEPGMVVCPEFNPNEVMGNPYLSWAGQVGSEPICGGDNAQWYDENADGVPDTEGPFCNYQAFSGLNSTEAMDGLVIATFTPALLPFEPYVGVGDGMHIIDINGASNYGDLGDAKLLTRFELVFQNEGVFSVCGIRPENAGEITATGIMFMSDMFDGLGTFRWLTEYPNPVDAPDYNPNFRQLDCTLGKVRLVAAQEAEPIEIDIDNPNHPWYSYPPNGSIDARRARNLITNAAEGWTTVDLRFTGPAQSATCTSAASCVEIYRVSQSHRVQYHPCQAGAYPDDSCIEALPQVASAQIVTSSPVGGTTSNNTVRLTLTKRISPLTKTTFTHLPSQTSTVISSLPGDVDANGWSNPRDTRALQDYCVGTCTGALQIWQYDINRSGAFEHIDDYRALLALFRMIDVHPGFQNWTGRRLPD